MSSTKSAWPTGTIEAILLTTKIGHWLVKRRVPIWVGLGWGASPGWLS